MSEAADAAQETEDFFNEEIFGAPKPVDNEQPFPMEDPPESKPVEEIAVDPEEETPQEDELEDESGSEPSEQSEPDPEPEVEDADAHLTWARKKFGEGIDLESESSRTLAKAAYEQERMIGKQAEDRRKEDEARAQQQEQWNLQRQRQQIQAQVDYLSSPGSLTAEEDAWIDEAVESDNPGAAADALLEAGRHDLYGSFVSRWVQQGDLEAQQAMAHRDHVLAWATAPAPPEPTKTEALAQTVAAVCQDRGLDPNEYGPKILEKLGQLPGGHWTRQAFDSNDPRMWTSAFQGTLDLVAAGATSVHAARQDDVVQQRVQEEQLRRNASGIQSGGPRVERPKSTPFWNEFEEEEERINSRPQYGRE